MLANSRGWWPVKDGLPSNLYFKHEEYNIKLYLTNLVGYGTIMEHYT